MITSGGPSATRDGHVDDAADLRWFVFALFFIFGGITSLNDVIIPKLKELFVLSYGQGLLVQSAPSPLISYSPSPPPASFGGSGTCVRLLSA